MWFFFAYLCFIIILHDIVYPYAYEEFHWNSNKVYDPFDLFDRIFLDLFLCSQQMNETVF